MSTLFALELPPRVRMEKKRQKGRDIKEEDELTPTPALLWYRSLFLHFTMLAEQESRKSFIRLL